MTPTNAIVGREGSGAGGRAVNAVKSLKAVKTALGGVPLTSSTSSDVNLETARVASARRTAHFSQRIDELRDPPGGRPIRTRECPPIAVYLNDDSGRPAPECAPDEHGGAKNRIGREDHIRTELSDVSRDAKRQPQVEDDTVEHVRPERRCQPEA